MRYGHLFIGLGLMLASGLARADVVAPPDHGTCPPGTAPGDSHGLSPAWCGVLACEADSDCKDGKVCREQALCQSRMWATASCPDGTCSGAFPCETLKVCVDMSANEASEAGEGSVTPTARGCGCSVDDELPLGLSALVLLVAGIALRRRR